MAPIGNSTCACIKKVNYISSGHQGLLLCFTMLEIFNLAQTFFSFFFGGVGSHVSPTFGEHAVTFFDFPDHDPVLLIHVTSGAPRPVPS